MAELISAPTRIPVPGGKVIDEYVGRVNSDSESVSSASIMIGTLVALYCMISGGTAPGGIWRTAVCAIAVVWAIACATSEPGCR